STSRSPTSSIPGCRGSICVPGGRPRAYWRDIDTLRALAEARHDAFAGPSPLLDLRNPAWPLQPDSPALPLAHRTTPRESGIALR
ncbi:MAG: hypothetical protein WD118_10735, partial [Phycisphaeraceae bacterium]